MSRGASFDAAIPQWQALRIVQLYSQTSRAFLQVFDIGQQHLREARTRPARLNLPRKRSQPPPPATALASNFHWQTAPRFSNFAPHLPVQQSPRLRNRNEPVERSNDQVCTAGKSCGQKWKPEMSDFFVQGCIENHVTTRAPTSRARAIADCPCRRSSSSSRLLGLMRKSDCEACVSDGAQSSSVAPLTSPDIHEWILAGFRIARTSAAPECARYRCAISPGHLESSMLRPTRDGCRGAMDQERRLRPEGSRSAARRELFELCLILKTDRASPRSPCNSHRVRRQTGPTRVEESPGTNDRRWTGLVCCPSRDR